MLRFDQLAAYLEEKNYDKEVWIFEDGTKIVETVDLSSDSKCLLGLVAPFDQKTGLPIPEYHSACSGWEIYNSMKNFEKFSYIQLIVAQPNHTGNVLCVWKLKYSI